MSKNIFIILSICVNSVFSQSNNIITQLIDLDKYKIITGEPIWLTVKVTNNSDYKIVLDEDYVETNMVVTDANGKVWKRNLKGFRIYVPRFSPGQTAYYSYELNEKYGVMNSKVQVPHLPPGHYQIQLVFKPVVDPKQIKSKGVVFNPVKSNTLSFNVNNPSGKEKEVFDLLNSAMKQLFDTHHRDKRKSMEHFDLIINNYPNSVYHERALRFAASVYSYSDEDSLVNISLSKYAQLLELYPDTRYYKLALGEIINISRTGKDRSFALTCLEKVATSHKDPRAREFAKKQIQWINSAPEEEWNYKLRGEKIKKELEERRKINEGN